MPKNIGIDIRVLMDTRYSGVAEYVFNWLTNLLELDKENNYYLFANSFNKQARDRLPKFDQPNVHVVVRGFPNKFLNYCLFKFFAHPKIDKLLGVKLDIFLMPHFNFMALPKNCLNILTIHDISFLRQASWFNFRKNFWHKMINLPKFIKQFDKIVAISNNTKNDLIELLGASSDKVSVIYSGINELYKKLEQGSLDEIKNKLNLPARFILALNTLEPRKNLIGLIQAFAELKKDPTLSDVKLIIAGDQGWKFENIFKLISDLGLIDDIRFLGYVNDQTKLALYNLAKIFVFPSFYEGFGFPPLEAMACGCPVICAYGSSLSEVVGDSAILVDPFNAGELVVAMNSLLTDQNLSERFSLVGLERVKGFSWQRTAERYFEVIKNG